MWIKQPATKNGIGTALSRLGRSRFVLLFLFILFSAFMFLLGAYYHDSGRLYGAQELLNQNYRVPLNYVRGLTSRPAHLVIDIKHKHYQRLAYNRKIALERGALLPDARDEVPAYLRFEDRVIKARLRLKGDLPDHWRADKKWSFRIRTRGEETLFGMKQFSIQHPRTRGFLIEWFLHRFLADHGLIGLRYDFITVTVNGMNLGLYAVEEHFEKRLIEHNRNREGPIFRADTWFYWYHKPGLTKGIYGTAVDAYQTKQMAENPLLVSQFRVARNLFEAFREGDLETHQVFDVGKFATFFAILDLMGHAHAGDLDNLALYYNPITSRIEPVAADTGLRPAGTLLGASRTLALQAGHAAAAADWFDLLFRDPVFFAAYVQALEKISQPQVLDEFFRKHEEDYEEKLRILHRSFPWYSFEEEKQILYRNQRFIADFLSPVKSFQAYVRSYPPAAKTLDLEVASIHAMPVEIVSVSLPGGMAIKPLAKTILQPNERSGPLKFQDVALQLPPELELDATMVEGLRLHHHILGASLFQQDAVHPWPHRDSAFLEHDFIRQPSNFETFEFVRFDPEGKRILIAPGEWRLDRSLILPPGYTVVGGPGTRLDLSGGAKLLSYSPLELRGSNEDPFIIESSDATGQGLVVLRTGDLSVLEHVHFENLDNPEQAGWELTGAVTFYESPVKFSHCAFSASRAEDALNVVRGEFLIEQSVFDQAAFDALDVDFGQGRIVRTSFVECGNDGIDVSGTSLQLEDVLINGAGDKALSAGEHSSVTGRRVIVRNAEIAVASKDMSEVNLETLEIGDSRVGFAIFQKKPEYGPGHLVATGVSLDSVEVPYLIAEGSRCSMNGKELAATHRNVEELLYGAQYGKSSG